uniref:Uncharacterized protein n=1 Tax=viral metagenome TaxID=1070528 RepID=A0A6M3L1U8_9ZZZZ
MNWQEDKRWSDQFLPEIKRLLGGVLISEPPIEEDTQRNTDLIVLKLDAVRVACRVRRPKYYPRYAGDFTVRADRPRGTKTELAKIIEGWGDYFFYGFGSKKPGELALWHLGALDVFRLYFMRYLVQNSGELPGVLLFNDDGSSSFRAFKYANLPSDFIVAMSEDSL